MTAGGRQSLGPLPSLRQDLPQPLRRLSPRYPPPGPVQQNLHARDERVGFAERRASAFVRLTPVAGSALDPISRSPRKDQFPYRGVASRAHDARAGDQLGHSILDLFNLAQTSNALQGLMRGRCAFRSRMMFAVGEKPDAS